MTVRNMTCINCGSDNLHRDAWAVWNPERLEWELGDVYDEDIWCAECDSYGWSNVLEVSQ